MFEGSGLGGAVGEGVGGVTETRVGANVAAGWVVSTAVQADRKRVRNTDKVGRKFFIELAAVIRFMLEC